MVVSRLWCIFYFFNDVWYIYLVRKNYEMIEIVQFNEVEIVVAREFKFYDWIIKKNI
jgi:hypothetical protein